MRAGISQARQRLGAEPLSVLFERTAQAWCALDAASYAWKGLSLWGMDRTTFRMPDSPDNRAFFGVQGYASGKAASYPQVRGVSLMALSTRLVADMALREYDTNEMRYAEELVPRILLTSLMDQRKFKASEIAVSADPTPSWLPAAGYPPGSPGSCS